VSSNIDFVVLLWCCFGITCLLVINPLGVVKSWEIHDSVVFCRRVEMSDRWSTGLSEILKIDVSVVVDDDKEDKVSVS